MKVTQANYQKPHTAGFGEMFDLRTGENKYTWETGKACRMQFTGNQNVLVYRAFTSAYFDIGNKSQQELFPGRAGCLTHAAIGGGVLVQPDESGGCNCTFPMRTAIAYVHADKLDQYQNGGPILTRPLEPPQSLIANKDDLVEVSYFTLSGRKVYQGNPLQNLEQSMERAARSLSRGNYIVKIVTRSRDGAITGTSCQKAFVSK